MSDDAPTVAQVRPSVMLFAYFAPEVALPVASVLAAAFGFVMMVGKAPFKLAARALRSAFKVRDRDS
jgi:hypothetical protein